MDEKKGIPISGPAREYRNYLRKRKNEDGQLPPVQETKQVKNRLRRALRNEEGRESDYLDEMKRVGFDRQIIAEKALVLADNLSAFGYNRATLESYSHDGRILANVEELRLKAHASLEGLKDFSTPQKIAGIAIVDLMLEQDAGEIITANFFSQHLEYKKNVLDRTEFLRQKRMEFHVKSLAQRMAKKITNSAYYKDDWAGFIDNSEANEMVEAIHDFFLERVPKTEGRQFSPIRRDFLSFMRMLATDPILSKQVFNKVPALHEIDEFAVRVNNMYESAAPIALSEKGMFIDPSVEHGTSASLHVQELFDAASSLIQRYIARSILQEHRNKPELQRELAELNLTLETLGNSLNEKEPLRRTFFDLRYRAQRKDLKEQYDDAMRRREEVYKKLAESYGRSVTKVIMDQDAERAYVFPTT